MKKKIAFICVHNSCRSQMAEAIMRLRASDQFEIYSAGSDISRGINEDAAAIMLDRYNVDIKKEQEVKLIESLPDDLDYVISMGCEVECPHIPNAIYDDWALEDPSDKGYKVFEECVEKIELKIQKFLNKEV